MVAAGKRSERFEDLYQQLEETVARLEQGGLTLDETLALYERGMGLARRCQEMLQEAELKITQLKEALRAEHQDEASAAYTVPEEEGEAEGFC